MKVHNIMEDIVNARLESVSSSITKDDSANPEYKEVCKSPQCRLDIACYVLNRVKPRYFVSSRGLEREGMVSLEKQQSDADIVALIFEAFKVIVQNQHPTHFSQKTEKKVCTGAVFNIPAIIGKILDGRNFAPINGINVSLYKNGNLLEMNNENWQNPCTISAKTQGVFTFWPESIPAPQVGENTVFELELRADGAGFEPLFHIFEVPLTSEVVTAEAISMENTLKLPSLYMFPPESVG